MQPLTITRKLFVTPLGDNNHGKTRLIRSVVNHGRRQRLEAVRRGPQHLVTPWGRVVDALIIPRSFQETLKREYASVLDALDGVDSEWRTRDLVVFPSHLVSDDCQAMIAAAHGAGFDAIAASVVLTAQEIARHHDCVALRWDERWTLFNTEATRPDAQLDALGGDLWTWIAHAGAQR
jgi:hypothetical protein